MWTALITGLAALTGAAIGGLVTVWATHKTNVAAAERERAQRLHDRQTVEYDEAKEIVSRFVALWLKAISAKKSSQTDLLSMFEMTDYGTRVQLLIPQLSDGVTAMVAALDKSNNTVQSGDLRGRFIESAREELKKLEPKA